MASETTPLATLLIVDDDEQTIELIRGAMEFPDLHVIWAMSAIEGIESFKEHRPRIVLVDLRLPDMSGMEVLEKLLSIDPGVEVILITGHYSSETAVEAIQKGAADYLNKPLAIDHLRARIGQILENLRHRLKYHSLMNEVLNIAQFQDMVGRSPAIIEVFSRIQRVAPHFRTVLVSGETGTGKELVARALHKMSGAPVEKYGVCNCAAVVDTLFESELFGYVKGAFTGANTDKIGLFEYANNGTVFLDEIGEMPLATQAKLLRVLQTQEVQRVGSPVPRKIDVRIVAATNKNLRTMVKEKQFREDLFYRLSMIEIHLPKLADRLEDLPLLIRHFTEHFAKQYKKPIEGISRRAQILLSRYSWPGNIRELENVIGNACMMADSPVIDVDDLPAVICEPMTLNKFSDDTMLTLDEVQKRHAKSVLQKVKGNKAQAAGVLGISRATLYKIISDD